MAIKMAALRAEQHPVTRVDWHHRFDRAVIRAEKVKATDEEGRLPRLVHALADDVIWLTEHYPAPEVDALRDAAPAMKAVLEGLIQCVPPTPPGYDEHGGAAFAPWVRSLIEGQNVARALLAKISGITPAPSGAPPARLDQGDSR